MRGGIIENNVSADSMGVPTEKGHGVVMDMLASTAPLFSMGGSARIVNNDVHLHYNDYYQYCFITIESSLSAVNTGEIQVTMDDYPASGSSIKVLGETASGLVSANYLKFAVPSPYGINNSGRLYR
jgi:hypothetical protein